MIRSYTSADTQRTIDLLDALHRRSPYLAIQPNWERVIRLLSHASSKPDGIVLLDDTAGKIQGVLVGIVNGIWWQPEARIASDLLFYSRRVGGGLAMLRGFKAWAFSHPNVLRIECGISSGRNIDRVAPLYELAGLHREGSMYVANHPNYETAARGKRVVQ